MKLEVIYDNSTKVVLVPKEQPARRLWMKPHDRMMFDYDAPLSGGWRFNPRVNGKARAVCRINNKSYPEIYRMLPLHGTKLTEAHIELLCGINPELTPDKARSLLGTGLAFCNGSFAVFDQPRLMGGAIITGDEGFSVLQGLVDGARLLADIVTRRPSLLGAKTRFRAITAGTPNILYIKSLKLSDPIPKAEDMLNDFTAWFRCVGVQPDADINLWWRKGADGKDYNPRMFYITRVQTYIRLDELFELPAGFIPPSPQWMPAPTSLI